MTLQTCELILFHKFLPAAIGRGIHSLDTHRIKACLLADTPLMQSAAVLADLSQPSAGNGYVTGGVICGVSPLSEYVGGEYSFRLSYVPSFTSSGTGYSFRGVAIYNDSAASKNVIGAGFLSTAGQVAITSVEQTGQTATITKTSHGLANGDIVVIDRLPYAWMNGTRTVGNVTANKFDITSLPTHEIAHHSVASGKLVKPAPITLAPGGTYTVSFLATGAFSITRT